MRRYFRLTDAVIIACVLIFAVISLFLLFQKHEGKLLVLITTGNDDAQTYPLDEDRVISVSSGKYHLTVEIKDGGVRVSEADCPDKVCLHTKEIRTRGYPIVCVPARVIIRIEAEGDDCDYDAVAH